MQKNKNRPRYMETKVGWIPEDWKCTGLKDCSTKIGSGITPRGGKDVYVSEGIPFIRSQNVLEGKFCSNGLKFISNEQHKNMKSSALQMGDVLFNITGASIGRCCLIPDQYRDANVNQHVCIVRLKHDYHTGLFVSILNSSITKKQLYENQAGGGREGLNFQNLGSFRIPLPLLPEQEAIAAVLECWDKVIRNYERKIKKGLMQRMLSGKQRLPGFEGEWEEVRLEDVCTMKNGETITSKSIYDKAEYPCFGGNGLRGFTTTFTHDGEFVLIGRQGALCGNVHLVYGKFYASEHSIVTTPSETTNPSWLAEVLWFIKLNRHTESSAQPGLSVSKVLRMQVFAPPPPEQQAIASILSSADADIAALERKLAAMKEQKRFLLNNLVTGTIRLPQFAGAGKAPGTDGDTE